MSARVRHWWLVVAGIAAAAMAASWTGVVLTPVPVAPNVFIVGLSAFPVVGGLVVARQPVNLVGRLLVAVGIWFSIGAAANTYLWVSLETTLPAIESAAWMATWAYWPGFALIPWIVAIFPSGRLASPWLRSPLAAGIVALHVLSLILMFVPAPVNVAFFGEQVTNPWGVAGLSPLMFVDDLLPFLAAGLMAVVVTDLAVRWRRSVGVERLQMRWVGLGILAIAILAVIGVLGEALDFTGLLIVLWVSFGVLPVAIGLAVMRFRLYEIDRLISRTVSYAVVAGLLAAVFAVIAIGLPRLVGVPDENRFLVAGATLAVAALFNPVRRRVHLAVDRRFNRARYDAQREVERLSERLRSEVELDNVSDDLISVVTDTLQPESATVWIRSR